MSKVVLTDVSVVLNSVDLSDHVRSVTLERQVDSPEASTMSTPSREFLWGVDSWSGSIQFTEDYAAAKVNATLESVFAGRTAVSLVVKPTSSAVGPTNPSFTGNVIPTTFPVIDGEWGAVLETGLSFQGTGTLTRATA